MTRNSNLGGSSRSATTLTARPDGLCAGLPRAHAPGRGSFAAPRGRALAIGHHTLVVVQNALALAHSHFAVTEALYSGTYSAVRTRSALASCTRGIIDSCSIPSSSLLCCPGRARLALPLCISPPCISELLQVVVSRPVLLARAVSHRCLGRAGVLTDHGRFVCLQGLPVHVRQVARRVFRMR